MISSAWAQDAATTATQAPTGMAMVFSYLPLVFVFAIFYFLIIRPQNKAAREHANLISQLKKGQFVMVSGGMMGQITRLSDDVLVVSVGKDTHVNVAKTSVTRVLSEKEANQLHLGNDGPVVDVDVVAEPKKAGKGKK